MIEMACDIEYETKISSLVLRASVV